MAVDEEVMASYKSMSVSELVEHLSNLDEKERRHHAAQFALFWGRESPAKLVEVVEELWRKGTKREEEGEGDDAFVKSFCLELSVRLVLFSRFSKEKTSFPKREEWLIEKLRCGHVRLAKLCGREVGKTCSAERIKSFLAKIGPTLRSVVLSALVKAKRTAVADELFPFVLQKLEDHHSAALLITGCSYDLVSAHLCTIRHALRNWSRFKGPLLSKALLLDLTKRIDEALAQRASETKINSLWSQVDSGLDALALHHPKELLHLAMRSSLNNGSGLPYYVNERLRIAATGAPELVGQILTHRLYKQRTTNKLFGLSNTFRTKGKGLNNKKMQKKLRSLPKEATQKLVELLLSKCGNLTNLRIVLKAFSPSVRGVLFEEACESAGSAASNQMWPDNLMEILPHRVRIAQAERICKLKAVSQSPVRLLNMTAYCDIVTSRESLEKAARMPAVDERIRGLSLLIKCTGINRKGLTDTLTFVAARAMKDQDPVKTSVFNSISQYMPLTLFKSEDYKILRELVHEALVGRDSSSHTRHTVRSLAKLFLEEDICLKEGWATSETFLFGLELNQMLMNTNPSSFQPGIPILSFRQRVWQRGADSIYAAVIQPALEKNADDLKTKLDVAIVAAEHLGEYCWETSTVQDCLKECALHSKNYFQAVRAAKYWLKNPKQRDERVRLLLDHDFSSYRFPMVAHHLVNRRQSWLDPIVEGKASKSDRFTDSNPLLYWYPVGISGVKLLGPRQVLIYREYLKEAIESTSSKLRVAAMGLLPRLPGVTIEYLQRYLSPSSESLLSVPESERKTVIEVALGGLVWTDYPAKALPTLMQFLDGDHVHVAMYAIRKVIRVMAEDEALEVLKDILLQERIKITVQKEAVRILGSLGTRGFAYLCEMWEAGKQTQSTHRDVKISFGRAATLQQLTHAESAWDMLSDLASDADETVARSILSFSNELTSRTSEVATRYVNLVFKLIHHPSPTLRNLTFNRLSMMINGLGEKVADTTIEASVRCIEDFEDTAVWHAAIPVLIAAFRAGSSKGRGEFLAHIKRLLGAKVLPKHNAQKESPDLPARRRLQGICERLRQLSLIDISRLRDVLSEVASYIEKDETLWDAATKLKLHLINWADFSGSVVTFFKEVVCSASQVPSLRIQQLTTSTLNYFARNQTVWSPSDLEKLKQCLSDWEEEAGAKNHSALGHLQLVLVKAVGQRYGWETPWVEYLRILRDHSDPGVRAIALDQRIGVL